MLWIKALHIIFMVTWFAGLFYLPRLFVYHADCTDEVSHTRFLVMERKLFAIMTIGAVLTAVFGTWLLVEYAWAAYGNSGWLITKLVLVGGLIAYHLYCSRLMREFRNGTATHSHVFYRWINEIPALLLIAIVLLAVVKPF
ncbi:MAG: CopD family protein [Gammaproteobacteria bacterium]|nr:CopD family protein [Gammaproteobacteria bacterium]